MSVQMFFCLFSIQTKEVETNDTLDIQIHPNTSSEAVLSTFLGSNYLLSRCSKEQMIDKRTKNTSPIGCPSLFQLQCLHSFNKFVVCNTQPFCKWFWSGLNGYLNTFDHRVFGALGFNCLGKWENLMPPSRSCQTQTICPPFNAGFFAIFLVLLTAALSRGAKRGRRYPFIGEGLLMECQWPNFRNAGCS